MMQGKAFFPNEANLDRMKEITETRVVPDAQVSVNPLRKICTQIFAISFRCFVGEENDMTVEDCIERSLLRLNQHPHEVSRSVSEMKEWVCSKINRPDGTVIRDCMNMYTGGEPFDVCLSNSHEGKKCLCSSELCNSSTRHKANDIMNIILAKMSLIYLLINIFL